MELKYYGYVLVFTLLFGAIKNLLSIEDAILVGIVLIVSTLTYNQASKK